MTTTEPEDKRPARHARFLRSHGLVRTLGLVLVAALAGVSGAAYGFARHYQGNISSNDASFLTDTVAHKKQDPKDPDAGNDLNILILGSDSRGGDNGTIVKDGNGGQRSDTAIVMHISANRKRVDMVSIPRDSMVNVPACTIDKQGDKTAAAGTAMFNSAFAYGVNKAAALGKSADETMAAGAACTWQTVEDNTGIKLDGYVVLDFHGFEGMINALGGVPMCIPEAVDVPKADLKLDAGYQTLKGADALGYARAREGIGDGSDLGRIKRQQDLMASIANKVFAQNFVTDSPKLLKFVDAATKSLYTSKTDDLDLGSLTSIMGLAYSLRHVSTSNVTFLTIPNGQYAPDHARVAWTEPQAQTVWDKLAKDQPITASAAKTSKPKSTSSATTGSSTTKSTPTAPATPKNRDTDGLSASDVTSSKATCTS